ncbi:hypothetical protein JG687_00011322 [Phytophthora cactorum]|uniref:Uncharacterized protein n=1 Tax=Phytophthora cactorum TaxID=29920 RepID=A0A8T1UA18_9STRA|nr:hypothetical protein PC123_g4967 [Phytophthora cactorum]KAG6955286.1 hypothetical protein JG687_00011322 [Phytophthora cactorum]
MSDPLPKFSNKSSQAAFACLEPNEQSARTVLTHAEKYNMARSLSDPVIDLVTRLSSAKCYKQVQDWEMIITKATDAEQVGLSSDDEEGGGDDSLSDPGSEYDSDVLLDADDYFLELGDLLDVHENLGFDEVPSSATQLFR